MGCLDSNSTELKENNNSNYLRKNNNCIDTDNFSEENFPHFQPNFYDKNIKNIKKVYEERIIEGNNKIIKIHKIFIVINYQNKNTTSYEIEIEKLGKQIVRKHLKKMNHTGCSLDNIKLLLEKYNSTFNIDSSQWYQSKETTDIYIKAEKDTNNVIKYFQMFYEKDTSTLKFNKMIKYNISDVSSNEEYLNIKPKEVVIKYNDLKLLYKDNKPEIFKDVKNKKGSGGFASNENYYNYDYMNNYNNYDDNVNYGYHRINSSGIFRNRDNREIGRIDSNGYIRDENNREVGRFEDDGVIRDENNREVGRFDDDGVYRDENNREPGRVEDDGVVRDENNREIGRIDSDGVVRDSCNNEIGRAEGISNEEAAYMYFFKD